MLDWIWKLTKPLSWIQTRTTKKYPRWRAKLLKLRFRGRWDFLLVLLLCGCEPVKPIEHENALEIDGGVSGSYMLQIVEYKGHRFAIVKCSPGIAICEVTEASAIKEEVKVKIMTPVMFTTNLFITNIYEDVTPMDLRDNRTNSAKP